MKGSMKIERVFRPPVLFKGCGVGRRSIPLYVGYAYGLLDITKRGVGGLTGEVLFLIKRELFQWRSKWEDRGFSVFGERQKKWEDRVVFWGGGGVAGGYPSGEDASQGNEEVSPRLEPDKGAWRRSLVRMGCVVLHGESACDGEAGGLFCRQGS